MTKPLNIAGIDGRELAWQLFESVINKKNRSKPMDLKAADYVVVIVSDLDKSLHFYSEVLGLPLHHRAQNLPKDE